MTLAMKNTFIVIFCLVEWPQKIEGLLPEKFIKVEIQITGETQRTFNFNRISN